MIDWYCRPLFFCYGDSYRFFRKGLPLNFMRLSTCDGHPEGKAILGVFELVVLDISGVKELLDAHLFVL